MTIALHFHGDLSQLLRRRWQNKKKIQLPLKRAASIKDVVESFGLPHTEIGCLQVDGKEVDFHFKVDSPCRIEVKPVTTPWDIFSPTLLRPKSLAVLRFLVDINVGKLARLLRMAGFDAATQPEFDDSQLAAYAEADSRLLLSKDRGLLMRKQVHFGRLVRATNPADQLQEVIALLGLDGQLHPLSRCLECNTLLEKVDKKKIDHLLEPLTRKYYTNFSRCPSCAKIYWPGSHVDKMLKHWLQG